MTSITRDFDTPYRRDPLDRAQLLDAQRSELHALAALATQGRVGDPLVKSLAALATRLEQAAELDCDGYEEFLRRLVRDRERRERMHAVNPKYVFRNHLAQLAIDQAEQGDASLIHELLQLSVDVFGGGRPRPLRRSGAVRKAGGKKY